MVVHTNTEKVRKMRHLYLELLLSDHNSFCTPPCRDACPTHIKIPQFLDAIAHGDYKTGVRKLREDLPFPAILGRVCPRPCEGPCRRQLVEQPITICWLHRFMADQCIDEEQTGELLLPVEPKPDSGKRIAIVGGGPAGLACAFYARLEGHAVKIFEALPKPGGMLRYGIPSYRLPRDVHRQGAQRAVAHGRRARMRHPAGRRLPDGRPHVRTTTRSSSASAPSTPTRWASPTKTPTAWSPRSTFSASSSSPATCTWATR